MRLTNRLIAPLIWLLPGAVPAVHAGEAASAVVSEIASGVYSFQYRGYQSMFVIDPQGVVVTDPISATTAPLYLAEIRKLTAAPIRYVIYSHHHFDHIEGGTAFREPGTVFVSHRNARTQLARMANPKIVLPELLVDDRATIEVGNTRVELHYLGRNHSDNSLVTVVPAQRVAYAADWLAVREIPWRNLFDSYIDEWLEGIDRAVQLDWERLVIGHTRPHNPNGWATKDDLREYKGYFLDLKEAIRVAHASGQCPDRAPREVRLPKYESWYQYEAHLPLNIDRMCLYWRNGWQ